ncbi:hypothetical protein RsoM2USA_187 [Ralstonia phage RsoM2USA]|nr:hypothetical protein RsoM2USA_187 [Ralstonia phage RsoM2USA]
MTGFQMLALVLLFATKHMIVDFFLQTPKMVEEKSNFFKIGGYVHAAQHGLATMIILDPWVKGPLYILFAPFLIDFLCHYLIDWSKMNLGKKFNLTPSDKVFWDLIGVDQWLHFVTYIFILWYINCLPIELLSL